MLQVLSVFIKLWHCKSFHCVMWCGNALLPQVRCHDCPINSKAPHYLLVPVVTQGVSGEENRSVGSDHKYLLVLVRYRWHRNNVVSSDTEWNAVRYCWCSWWMKLYYIHLWPCFWDYLPESWVRE